MVALEDHPVSVAVHAVVAQSQQLHLGAGVGQVVAHLGVEVAEDGRLGGDQQHRDPAQALHRDGGEPVGEAGEPVGRGAEGRPERLESNDRTDQRGALGGDQPAGGGARGVCEQDGLTDAVHKLRAETAFEGVGDAQVSRHRPGPREELEDRRVALGRTALAGPLGLEVRGGVNTLRAAKQDAHRLGRRGGAHLSEGVRPLGAPPVSGAVHDVDTMTAAGQLRRPAGPSVRCAHPVRALAAAAMDEHERRRAARLGP